MNTLLQSVLHRHRLILPVAALLALSGVLAWFTMPRQEDPTMPDRFGFVVVAYPGASAQTVERLVTDPIEEQLAQVAQVYEVSSTSRTDVSVLQVRLGDAIYDTRAAWDEVQEALDKAQADLPEGALKPELTHEITTDQHAVVLAVTGSLDRRALLNGAKEVKQALLRVRGVSAVTLEGDPQEQVVVELDDLQARRLGLAPGALAKALAAKNRSLPAGALRVAGRNTSLRAVAELQSLEDLADSEIHLGSGHSVPLKEVARVRLGPKEPHAVLTRFNGADAVAVAVVPKPGIDVVALGQRVRDALGPIRARAAPLKIETLSFQPDFVSQRLDGLGRSLLLGIVIVAAILILSMGIRLGLVVASVVPLVALSALAVYAMDGGILHQISVSALIIALGMLVDNAIVMAEAVQQKMDAGQPANLAAVEAVRELALPLATATGTTLAAFVPMYMSKGSTGDFTHAIPVVIMLTLVISYLYAVLVTPNLACIFLRARPTPSQTKLARLTQGIGRWATLYPVRILALAAVAVGIAGWGAGGLKKSFFPASGRNQLVVEVMHPEGTHIEQTDLTARAVEQHLMQDPRVHAVSTFVGRSAPRFYYNLPNRPQSPHFAHLVVQTHDASDVAGLSAELGEWARQNRPEAEVIPRELQQGPPIVAPVEVRLTGDDLPSLHAAAESVMRALRNTEGVRNVTHDLGLGVPALEFAVHEGAATRRGLSREDVGIALLAQSRGLLVGHLRSEADPIPILVRSGAGERTQLDTLAALSVPSATAGFVPLGQVSQTHVVWRPAAIHRRDGVREVAVTAHLQDGFTFGPVVKKVEATVTADQLPAGVHLGFGGAAKGSGEANSAIAQSAPIGAMLLLLFLMVEFNSYRRVLLILLTVPLAATGVVPGLLVADQPFGFMSLLGVFALVGVVVNNAIVLVDVIEIRRAEGLSVVDAVSASVTLRARPILLTTATTVAGLLPLALSPSPLWPPLASAMIAGLLASTFLTLLVVPAAYTLMFNRARPSTPRGLVSSAGVALMLLLSSAANAAPPLSEVLSRGAQRPGTEAARAGQEAAAAQSSAVWRQAYLPTVGAEAGISRIDRLLSLVTPVGSFPFGSQNAARVGVSITQPILDSARLWGLGPAASQEARAAEHRSTRTRQELAAQAGGRFFDVRTLRAQLTAARTYARSLETTAAQVRALSAAGRSLRADTLRIELAWADAKQEILALEDSLRVAQTALGLAIGQTGPMDAGEVDLELTLPPQKQGAALALQAREDLLALRAKVEATQKRQHGLWLELVPKLEARGLFVYDSGLPYDTNHYLQGSINAVWNPFAAGTRLARADALSASQRQLSAELESAQRGLRLQVEASYAAVHTAQGALQLATEAVAHAQEVVRVERLRYEEGQITVSELLEVEALLFRQEQRRAAAQFRRASAALLARLALGLPLNS